MCDHKVVPLCNSTSSSSSKTHAVTSHSNSPQRQSEMKAHIEQDYNTGYILSFQTKYLPFSWTCHHLYHPFSNLDPGQMAWSPSFSIPTVAPVTSVTYRGTVLPARAHQDTPCEEDEDLGNTEEDCRKTIEIVKLVMLFSPRGSCIMVMLHSSYLAF